MKKQWAAECSLSILLHCMSCSQTNVKALRQNGGASDVTSKSKKEEKNRVYDHDLRPVPGKAI